MRRCQQQKLHRAATVVQAGTAGAIGGRARHEMAACAQSGHCLNARTDGARSMRRERASCFLCGAEAVRPAVREYIIMRGGTRKLRGARARSARGGGVVPRFYIFVHAFRAPGCASRRESRRQETGLPQPTALAKNDTKERI